MTAAPAGTPALNHPLPERTVAKAIYERALKAIQDGTYERAEMIGPELRQCIHTQLLTWPCGRCAALAAGTALAAVGELRKREKRT